MPNISTFQGHPLYILFLYLISEELYGWNYFNCHPSYFDGGIYSMVEGSREKLERNLAVTLNWFREKFSLSVDKTRILLLHIILLATKVHFLFFFWDSLVFIHVWLKHFSWCSISRFASWFYVNVESKLQFFVNLSPTEFLGSFSFILFDLKSHKVTV